MRAGPVHSLHVRIGKKTRLSKPSAKNAADTGQPKARTSRRKGGKDGEAPAVGMYGKRYTK